MLKIGDTLLIKKESTSQDNDNDIQNNNEYIGYEYYTVISGDTLYSIAQKFGITVNQLKTINNLTSNILKIGQKLIVGQTSPTNIYTVQKGDTLYSIARMFNISVDDIKKANNLTSNTLSINQSLIIPSISNSSNIKTNSYVVQKGDTLYNIAKKFNTTVNDIKSINNLVSNVLSIGQQLIIPS